jgi:hypothetical protein
METTLWKGFIQPVNLSEEKSHANLHVLFEHLKLTGVRPVWICPRLPQPYRITYQLNLQALKLEA